MHSAAWHMAHGCVLHGCMLHFTKCLMQTKISRDQPSVLFISLTTCRRSVLPLLYRVAFAFALGGKLYTACTVVMYRSHVCTHGCMEVCRYVYMYMHCRTLLQVKRYIRMGLHSISLFLRRISLATWSFSNLSSGCHSTPSNSTASTQSRSCKCAARFQGSPNFHGPGRPKVQFRLCALL